LWKLVLPILVTFYSEKKIKLLKQEANLSVVAEEATSRFYSGESPGTSKLNNNYRYTEDLNTIVDFLTVKSPEKSPNQFADSSLSVFKYEEFMYNALYLVYNALRKGKNFVELNLFIS